MTFVYYDPPRRAAPTGLYLCNLLSNLTHSLSSTSARSPITSSSRGIICTFSIPMESKSLHHSEDASRDIYVYAFASAIRMKSAQTSGLSSCVGGCILALRIITGLTVFNRYAGAKTSSERCCWRFVEDGGILRMSDSAIMVCRLKLSSRRDPALMNPCTRSCVRTAVNPLVRVAPLRGIPQCIEKPAPFLKVLDAVCKEYRKD